MCLRPASAKSQVCAACSEPYVRAWCVGERSHALKDAINLYKYESARAGVGPLLELLDSVVPQLPSDTRVVPVPTISPHIRVRGYDHTSLLARRFAKVRGLDFSPILERVDVSRQQGSSKAKRLTQAKRAFRCRAAEHVPYLLIDDVYTTGATLHYAAKALRDAGASEVYVAVLARQPLEKA